VAARRRAAPARPRHPPPAARGVEDTEFWDRWADGPAFGTPLRYGAWLERFPRRAAGVVAAVARARPGGVAVQCGIGRDRAGLVSVLPLALAGVDPRAIAADHALGADGVALLHARRGERDPAAELDAFLAGEDTSSGEVIRSLLASLDVEPHLRADGLRDDDLAALRARLVEVVYSARTSAVPAAT